MFTFKTIDIYLSAPLLKIKEQNKDMIRVFIKKKIVLNFLPQKNKNTFILWVFFSELKQRKWIVFFVTAFPRFVLTDQ